MIAIPARTSRVMQWVLYPELRSGGGRGLNLAMVPRRELVQGIWDNRNGVGIEERSRGILLLLLLHVQAGAACTTLLFSIAFFGVFLARFATEKALAASLPATRRLHVAGFGVSELWMRCGVLRSMIFRARPLLAAWSSDQGAR